MAIVSDVKHTHYSYRHAHLDTQCCVEKYINDSLIIPLCFNQQMLQHTARDKVLLTSSQNNM